MTQQAEQPAVSSEPVVELTPEERLDAAFGDEPTAQEEDDKPLPVEGEESEPPVEVTEDDLEVEAEDDLPPIDAPVSWDAEAKEVFKTLPRDAQEIVTRREADREKFVQVKAQEASRARETAANEAAQAIAQIHAAAAAELETYAQQFQVPEPDPSLIVTDPVAYQQQVLAKQYYTAQRTEAQQKAEAARDQQRQALSFVEQQESQRFLQRLTEAVPEILDETTGPKLKAELMATGKTLGFTDEEINQAGATEIIALKQISELKAKADKYDALMAKKMERVRSGKNPPPISRPGVSQGPNAQQRANYSADREAMKHGDKDATTRVLDTFFTPNKKEPNQWPFQEAPIRPTRRSVAGRI